MTGRSTMQTLLEAARRAGPFAIPLLGVMASVATFIIWGLVPSLVILCILLALAVLVVASVAGESRTAPDVTDPGEAIETTTESVMVEVSIPPSPSETVGERSGDSPEIEESATQPSKSEPFSQAIAAAFEGDAKTTAERMDEYIATRVGDDIEFSRAIKEQLLVKAGDGSALGRLRVLASSSARVDVLVAFADSLVWLGQPAEAAEFLLEAVDRIPASNRATLELEAAEHLLEAGFGGAADGIASTVLGGPGTPVGTRARAFSLRAKVAKEFAPVRAMAFYELALREDPARSGDRFSLAYLYGRHSLYVQAISHYTILVENNQATATAYNNLAVAYGHVGMPQRASEYYAKAIDRGSALAAANMAHLAIDAGDVARADEMVKRGAELDPSDARLISATERLATGMRSETEKMEALVMSPKAVRSAILEHATVDVALPSLAGTQWQYRDGAVVFENAKYKAGHSVTLESGAELTLVGAGTHFLAGSTIDGAKYEGVGYVDGGQLVVLVNEAGGTGGRAFILSTPASDSRRDDGRDGDPG